MAKPLQRFARTLQHTQERIYNGRSGGDKQEMERQITLAVEGALGGEAIAGEAIVMGNAIYIGSDGMAYKAQASVTPLNNPVGAAMNNRAIGGTVKYRCVGTMTIPDWTTIAGSAQLTPGSRYYLSDDTAGTLTTTTPSVRIPMGVALSTTVFFVFPEVANVLSTTATLIVDIDGVFLVDIDGTYIAEVE